MEETVEVTLADAASARVSKRKRHGGAEQKKERKSDVVGYNFRIKDMIPHFTGMIYGARRVGKTHLASYIISKLHKRFKKVYLFSQTTELQPDAWSFIPEDHKFDHFDTVVLEGLYNKQVEEVSKARRSLEGRKPPLTGDALRDAISKKVPSILLILDDIINDTSVRGSGLLGKLFVSGRHLRFSLLFLSQTPARSATISRLMRSNVDYCFCSEFDTEDDLETIAGLFFCKEGKKAGIARIHQLTAEKHSFAVSELHKRGKVSLADHTFSIQAPAAWPAFELEEAKDIRNRLFVDGSGKRRTAASGPRMGWTSAGARGDPQFACERGARKFI